MTFAVWKSDWINAFLVSQVRKVVLRWVYHISFPVIALLCQEKQRKTTDEIFKIEKHENIHPLLTWMN